MLCCLKASRKPFLTHLPTSSVTITHGVMIIFINTSPRVYKVVFWKNGIFSKFRTKLYRSEQTIASMTTFYIEQTPKHGVSTCTKKMKKINISHIDFYWKM